MITKKTKPNILIFLLILIIRTIISLTTSNWLIIWCSLEINLISIIPILILEEKNYRIEARVKYFLIQAISSSILLPAFIIFLSNIFIITSIWIFLSSILIKIGIAPCHFWLVPIITNLSWSNLFIISTWQKLAPIFILRKLILRWNYIRITILVALNAAIGAIGGVRQAQIRPLLAYSSIAHISWIIIALNSSLIILFCYYLIYSITIFLITLTINYSEPFFNTNFSIQLNLSPISNKFLFIHILSLSGLPPLIGFFPKWIILQSSFYLYPILSCILLTSSFITIFYYLNIYIATHYTIKTNFFKVPFFNIILISFIVIIRMPILILLL